MAHLFKCVCTECIYVDQIALVQIALPTGQGVDRQPVLQTDKDKIANHNSILGHKMEYIQEV